VTADIRRRYDKKFKEETLKRVVAEGLSAAEVERRLNTGIGIVAHLVKLHYQPHGPARVPEDEPEKLKGEIARLRKERVKGPSDSLDPLNPSSRLVHYQQQRRIQARVVGGLQHSGLAHAPIRMSDYKIVRVGWSNENAPCGGKAIRPWIDIFSAADRTNSLFPFALKKASSQYMGISGAGWTCARADQ
jgi:hypothetical protein